MTEKLAARFRRFGTVEAVKRCPLYARLALEIADDEALLALAGHTRAGQPLPNMLFGAVRYLLFESPTHPLAGPFRTGTLPDGVFPMFRDFCLTQEARIKEIVETHRTQTNEVARCALWLPALSVASTIARRPVALVEIGSSAGLNLMFDKYRYDYGAGVTLGPPGSRVMLRCETVGDKQPPLRRMPAVSDRHGIDLNPIDVQNEMGTRWLLALVWPGHVEREQRLTAALGMAAIDPPDVRAGDALRELPKIVTQLDDDAALCVLHSFVLYQFTPDQRAALDAVLNEAAKDRPVMRIALETNLSGDSDLTLHSYTGNGRRAHKLATADPHGTWMHWTR